MGSVSPSMASTSPFGLHFHIGGVRIPNRAVLAPMAGLTISAYRRHLKSHGVGLVTTEMVSVHGLLHHNVRTAEYLKMADDERPVALQLFGDTPEAMAGAVDIVLSRPRPPDIIDINMGCPVRKVVKTGAGAALLGDPERALAVAAAAVGVAAVRGIPVTVKLRSGLRAADGERALVLGRRLEEAGVAGLCIHPRYAEQMYRGRADHSLTAAMVGSVRVPVVASGDVDSFASASAVLASTGAHAVMLARGAAGNPWLADDLLAGEDRPRPSLAVVISDLRLLLARVAEERGPERTARWMRKLLGWYLRPSGVSPTVVRRLRELSDVPELDAALAEMASSL